MDFDKRRWVVKCLNPEPSGAKLKDLDLRKKRLGSFSSVFMY